MFCNLASGPYISPLIRPINSVFYIILIVDSRPFQRGAAWHALGSHGMSNIGKRVGSATQKFAKMASLLVFTFVASSSIKNCTPTQ